MARNLGLETQLEGLDIPAKIADGDPQWLVADLSKQRIKELCRARNEVGVAGPAAGLREFVSFLQNGATERPRLLPLFFSGNRLLTQSFRFGSFFAPAPELALLLVDWAAAQPRAGGFSRVLGTMWNALLSGDIATVRKLSYAQQLVGAQRTRGRSGRRQTVLLDERNEKAARDVATAARMGQSKITLLYGCYHTEKIVDLLKESYGAKVVKTNWSAAWRVRARATQSRSTALAVAVIGIVLYLLVDALDWQSALVDSLSRDAPYLDVGAYVLRHGMVYFSLSKWLVQWERPLIEVASKSPNAEESLSQA